MLADVPPDVDDGAEEADVDALGCCCCFDFCDASFSF